MKKEIVVITGGPGTGKTSIINSLLKKGHICFPEISREITLEAQKKGIEQLFIEKPLLFSELLLEGRKKQYQEAIQHKNPIIFLDRGIPDILAYMHFIGDSYPTLFNEACKEHNYSHVFLLPPWKEIYKSDAARYESYEQAVVIYKHLKETYTSYGYNIIEVPTGTIEDRITFILNQFS